ncbi:MAG: hypothetical protein PHW79_03490, partial [Candidatus Marinimicrobia bacterium]|nr:hypothetical protein [Candidatus Neomarinimicrobiota bacterium]
SMAQAGGLLILHTLENPEKKLVVLSGMDDVRIRKPVIPGDQLRLEIKLTQFRLSTCKFRAAAYVNDDIVAEATIMATITDI